jgi:predicted CoA-binding protein
MDVVILGASSNPARYAYRAAERLKSAGHNIIGVNPALPEIPGVQVVKRIEELPPQQHTLTVYVAPTNSSSVADAIEKYAFKRVIFNPGSENPELAERLQAAGTHVVTACTLVMLATGQF